MLKSFSHQTQARTLAATLEITWDASTDNSILWGYNVYLNNEKINDEPITETGFKFSDLEMAVEYIIKVTAVDMAGNESGF